MTSTKSSGNFLPPLNRGPRLAAQRRAVFNDIQKRRTEFVKSLAVLGGPQITVENTLDQSPCPDYEFEFVAQNVPIEGVKLHDKEFISGCECQDCSSGSCGCLKDKMWHDNDPVEFAYDKKGHLLERILDEKLTIYECNSTCDCSDQCPNKMVMRGRTIMMEVFKTEDKGWAVRSPEVIPKGAFVTCYRGELLDSQTAELRGKTYDELGQTYLFDLDGFADDLEVQQLPMLTIDAYKKGDISRFFNHSCDPNLRSFAVSHGIAQEYDVAFFATRTIKAGEELCFDYDPGWSEKEAENLLNNVRDPVGKCQCNASNCRGWIFHK